LSGFAYRTHPARRLHNVETRLEDVPDRIRTGVIGVKGWPEEDDEGQD